jgi:hypothetical protein
MLHILPIEFESANLPLGVKYNQEGLCEFNINTSSNERFTLGAVILFFVR